MAPPSAMVGLDYPDGHEKNFPTCLRNPWLQDALRTVAQWCGIIFETLFIDLTLFIIYHIYAFVIYLLGLTPCALNGLPYHGIQVQSQVKVGLTYFKALKYEKFPCSKLISCIFVMLKDVQLLVGIERAGLTMHWRIHICIVLFAVTTRGRCCGSCVCCCHRYVWQTQMVQGSCTIFIEEWFPMFAGPLANIFVTFLHLPCQQAMYTTMVQFNGRHIRNDIVQLPRGPIKASFTRPPQSFIAQRLPLHPSNQTNA